MICDIELPRCILRFVGGRLNNKNRVYQCGAYFKTAHVMLQKLKVKSELKVLKKPLDSAASVALNTCSELVFEHVNTYQQIQKQMAISVLQNTFSGCGPAALLKPSSQRWCSVKKGVLKNFENFKGSTYVEVSL